MSRRREKNTFILVIFSSKLGQNKTQTNVTVYGILRSVRGGCIRAFYFLKDHIMPTHFQWPFSGDMTFPVKTLVCSAGCKQKRLPRSWSRRITPASCTSYFSIISSFFPTCWFSARILENEYYRQKHKWPSINTFTGPMQTKFPLKCCWLMLIKTWFHTFQS